MSSNKTTKIIYWVTTGLLALFILPGIFFVTSETATQGTAHLGLPMWFHWELSIGKFIGGIILILPFFPARLKEWVYVAFGIDFISALIAHIAVDGVSAMSLFPVFTFALLIASYITYHKIWVNKG
ncbi:DoxX-like family protein [Pseudarcicella hirudinis]|uniref:DoxX-like family protein n=1 Tax=Pseudarcicella hirudinis TaxID=1079859 RepID=A0A1I5URH1_9BACT|nr:DoxX family protein [Pseudarcicella hirudinis]SFP97894.1 DoxX-like family protein [Pseudarcicella hirudinis]